MREFHFLVGLSKVETDFGFNCIVLYANDYYIISEGVVVAKQLDVSLNIWKNDGC